MLSLQLVADEGSSNENQYSYGSYYHPLQNANSSITYNSHNYITSNANKSGGIKIKTQRDRLNETKSEEGSPITGTDITLW
jgi:hypothetical protein